MLGGVDSSVVALQPAPSGLYFVMGNRPHPHRAVDSARTGGMLSRYNPETGRLEEFFLVDGFLSSVAPDESAALLIYGPPNAVDLRLLRSSR